MSNERSFTEIIVSKLGTPHEPWGFGDFLVLGALLLAMTTWFMLEYGFPRLLAQLWRLTQPDAQQERQPPPAEPES